MKGLKLAYTVALGGVAANEYVMSTPLAEDGFLYVTNSAGVLYKIDARAGDVGRIAWRMDPGQEKQDRNRGAALWGNFVITAAGGRRASLPPIKIPAGWRGKPPSRIPRRSTSPRRRCRCATRSWSAPRAATTACATGWPASMPRPASSYGAPIRFRPPANPARRPGRTRTTPGAPAAAPSGSPAPTIRPPTRPSGAPATRCRCTTRPTGRAIICSPTAPSRSIPTPAR